MANARVYASTASVVMVGVLEAALVAALNKRVARTLLPTICNSILQVHVGVCACDAALTPPHQHGQGGDTCGSVCSAGPLARPSSSTHLIHFFSVVAEQLVANGRCDPMMDVDAKEVPKPANTPRSDTANTPCSHIKHVRTVQGGGGGGGQ
jgi:hypothetical protein